MIEQTETGLALTQRGREAARIVAAGTPPDRSEKIEEFKALLNDLTRDELLGFVYFGFAGSGVEQESAEYRRLLPIRGKLARTLYFKGRVSAERAAEIAGESLENFLADVKVGDV